MRSYPAPVERPSRVTRAIRTLCILLIVGMFASLFVFLGWIYYKNHIVSDKRLVGRWNVVMPEKIPSFQHYWTSPIFPGESRGPGYVRPAPGREIPVEGYWWRQDLVHYTLSFSSNGEWGRHVEHSSLDEGLDGQGRWEVIGRTTSYTLRVRLYGDTWMLKSDGDGNAPEPGEFYRDYDVTFDEQDRMIMEVPVWVPETVVESKQGSGSYVRYRAVTATEKLCFKKA